VKKVFEMAPFGGYSVVDVGRLSLWLQVMFSG
jgi:hypothetical protein